MLQHKMTRDELEAMRHQLFHFDFGQPVLPLNDEADRLGYDLLNLLLGMADELLKTDAQEFSGMELQKAMSRQWRTYAIKQIAAISDRDLAILSQFSLNLYVTAVDTLKVGEEAIFSQVMFIGGRSIMNTLRQLYRS